MATYEIELDDDVADLVEKISAATGKTEEEIVSEAMTAIYRRLFCG